jgi:hypothetical protein
MKPLIQFIDPVLNLRLHIRNHQLKAATAKRAAAAPPGGNKPIPQPGGGNAPKPQRLKLDGKPETVVRETIKTIDPTLHNKLYADRGHEVGALATINGIPPGLSISAKVLGVPMPLFARMALAGTAAVSRNAVNSSDAISQQAIKHMFLGGGRGWTQSAMRAAFPWIKDKPKQLSDILVRDADRSLRLAFQGGTPEEKYKANASRRYLNAAMDVHKNVPHALMPELNTTTGKATSAAAPVSQYFMDGIKGYVVPTASLGFNAARVGTNIYSANNRINSLSADTFAPKQPTFKDYLFNGFIANTDEKYINSIPANEWNAYLKQRALDEQRILAERQRYADEVKQYVRQLPEKINKLRREQDSMRFRQPSFSNK